MITQCWVSFGAKEIRQATPRLQPHKHFPLSRFDEIFSEASFFDLLRIDQHLLAKGREFWAWQGPRVLQGTPYPAPKFRIFYCLGIQAIVGDRLGCESAVWVFSRSKEEGEVLCTHLCSLRLHHIPYSQLPTTSRHLIYQLGDDRIHPNWSCSDHDCDHFFLMFIPIQPPTPLRPSQITSSPLLPWSTFPVTLQEALITFPNTIFTNPKLIPFPFLPRQIPPL